MARMSPAIAIAALALAGCGERDDRSAPAPRANVTTAAVVVPAPAASPVATSVAAAPEAPTACRDQIGATAAAQRVAICRAVSPATHPPCNVANSCAMIDHEIARSCALLGDDTARSTPGCGPAPKSGEAAVEVVRRYYAALSAHDYDTAWLQWGDNGRPGQNFAAFRNGFARTRSTRVAIGRVEPAEGGAGSVYVTVPVRVDAVLDDGTRQRFSGDYVVRRVNDIDGSSASSRRWHLDSARLSPG